MGMTKQEIELGRKLRTKIDLAAGKILTKVFKKYQPQTLKELIRLLEQYLEEETSGGGTDYTEQLKIIGMFKGEYVEVQDYQTYNPNSDNTIPHNPKPQPPTR